MKNTSCFYSIFFVLLLSCCTIPNSDKSSSDNTDIQSNSIVNSKKTDNISSETAIFIAKGFSCFDYDLKKYNVSAENDSENNWEVKFIGKEKRSKDFCCGGWDFSVFISKENGEITRATNGK